MCGDSLFDAIELRHCGPLSDPLFIDLHGLAARKEATATGDNRGPRELSVRHKRCRIRNRAIEGDPISLWSSCSLRTKAAARSLRSHGDRRPLWQLPIGAHEVTGVTVRVTLEIVLVLGLGFPEVAGGRDLCNHLAGP